ncbi:MAG: BppU family phage baseplate upper protein [Gammaproteobacteria bacterium]|nr:BppU family phage baseplate upper protein [Gammaproteobacteria bacterium]
MTDFEIKRNDTSPDLECTLQGNDGVSVDITGATVRFHMTKKGETTPKVDALATNVDEASGKVKYEWNAADTDTKGVFRGEFEVTYSDGSIETFPNNSYIPINIYEDLA